MAFGAVRGRDGSHAAIVVTAVPHPPGRPLRIRDVQQPRHLYVVDDVPEIERDAPLVLVSSQSSPTATDSDCWPEVLAAPSGLLAAASAPTLTVNDPDRLARRMGRHGLVGFGESYMAGEWESADLVAVLTIMAPALNHFVPRGLRRLTPLAI